MFPKALIDFSHKKYLSLLLDGKEIPGVLSIQYDSQ